MTVTVPLLVMSLSKSRRRPPLFVKSTRIVRTNSGKKQKETERRNKKTRRMEWKLSTSLLGGDLSVLSPWKLQASLLLQDSSIAATFVKGHLAGDKYVQHHTDGPCVGLFGVVRLAQQDLGRRVRLGTAVRSAQNIYIHTGTIERTIPCYVTSKHGTHQLASRTHLLRSRVQSPLTKPKSHILMWKLRSSRRFSSLRSR